MDLSLWCVIQRSRNCTKHSKLWTFFYAAWLRGSAFFFFKQNFGPFSKGRGLDLQIFNKTSKIVDLFGKPCTGSEVQIFYKRSKVVDLSLWRMAQRSMIFHKASKIVDLSFRHVAQRYRYKIQNSGPFFLRVVQRFRYLLKFQNCGPFVCRWVRDPDIS